MLANLYVRGMNRWSELLRSAREERGASAVEYGLLVSLIAAVIILIVSLLGKKVSNGFSTMESAFP
jgi:pilus assembly protein Flp/PilA